MVAYAGFCMRGGSFFTLNYPVWSRWKRVFFHKKVTGFANVAYPIPKRGHFLPCLEILRRDI